MNQALFDPAFDGHTHSPFCPHGAADPLAAYLDRAVGLGFRRYAVTEHMPLPAGFRDPMGPYQCAGPIADLPPYLTAVEQAREAYAGRLRVYVGLEVDYLGGVSPDWHEAVLDLLDTVWDRLEPEGTLLSVHFLGNSLVDGTVHLAAGLIPEGLSPDAYHLRYYAMLKEALTVSWRRRGRDLRPRRLSHLTLPRKFIAALPLAEPRRVDQAAREVLELVAAEGLELDLNSAGLDKAECGEIYLPEPLLGWAVELGIPLVFGSDAHRAAEVGRHHDAVLAALAAYR
jgi:histidinol-phosphatase (PHP family)